MKHIIILFAAFLSLTITGCSYVTDMIEAAISERASFSITAEYNAGQVIIRWDNPDSSDYFAGVEIYRTSIPDDEYSDYETVADRFYTGYSSLGTPINTCIDLAPPSGSGKTYFYRIGIIHWNEPEADRNEEHGYLEPWDASGTNIETNYDNHTTIDSISGYAKVVIP